MTIFPRFPKFESPWTASLYWGSAIATGLLLAWWTK